MDMAKYCLSPKSADKKGPLGAGRKNMFSLFGKDKGRDTGSSKSMSRTYVSKSRQSMPKPSFASPVKLSKRMSNKLLEADELF